jgi:hypothetical protein
MAELKTKATKASVVGFLDKVKDPERRKECRALAAMMTRATGEIPKMWGPSIVGFGVRRLKYASGREIDWPAVAFAARRQDLTLYGVLGARGADALLKRLGKHARGKGCLYIRRLSEVDAKVLQRLIDRAARREDTGA